MIKIYKSEEEPPRLAEVGKTRTETDLADYESDPEAYRQGIKSFSFPSNIYGDKVVKEMLIQSQYKKCCFCERLIGSDGDVEHFRPKSAYQQSKGDRLQRPGYFWLAYDWRNLYICCGPCNRNKGTLFPLSDPNNRAHLHNYTISLEDPLLIDPGQEDPRNSIRFRGEMPYAVNDSEKGRQTIRITKLDRGILNDDRRRHLRLMKKLYILVRRSAAEPTNKALQQTAEDASSLLRDATQPQAVFSSATLDAIDSKFEYVF